MHFGTHKISNGFVIHNHETIIDMLYTDSENKQQVFNILEAIFAESVGN